MLNPGDAMTDFEYADASGKRHRLSEVWQERPAWLLSMRHCGCAFFAEAMGDLGGSPEHDVARACILQADAAETARWCAQTRACATCVPDPQLQTFAAIGLERAAMRDILIPSPDLRERRKEAKARGARQNWLRTFARGNDVRQLPGAALVGTDGVIRYVHRGKHTGDQLTAAQLSQIAAGMAQR